jgi:hypothetical protein
MENLKGRNCFGYIQVDERIILKLSYKNNSVAGERIKIINDVRKELNMLILTITYIATGRNWQIK